MTPTRLPRITAGQFATMVTSGYLGLGIFYFPRPLVEAAGRSGLYGLWIDGLVAFILMALMFKMNRLVPTETFGGFARYLISGPVAFIMGVFTVLYNLSLALSATVLFSFVLANVFLPQTPIWAIDSALTLTGGYMALFGTKALARTLQTSYIPLLVLTVLSIALAASAIRHPLLLTPSLDVTLLPVVQGAYKQFVIFLGFQVSINLYPFIEDKGRRKAERYSYLALLGIVASLSLQYEVISGVFGPAMISHLRWPLASTYRIIAMPGFFIAKLGTFLVVLWSIIIVAFVSVRLWCLSHDFVQLLYPFIKIRYHWAITIMTAACIGGALLFPNANIADRFNEIYLLPLGLLYLVLLPAVVLLVGRLRPQQVLHLNTLSERGHDV